MKTWIKPAAITFLLLVCGLGVGSCVANRPYSEGHRDGYVQKFSRKGIIRKSWEGTGLGAYDREPPVGEIPNSL